MSSSTQGGASDACRKHCVARLMRGGGEGTGPGALHGHRVRR
jgi:hypothetical protein